MFKSFIRPKNDLFILFEQAATELVNAADKFNFLVLNLSQASTYAQHIASIEKAADKITNTIFESLHKAFITPFDHFDIQQMVIKLDNIVDAIHGTAQRIALYELKMLPSELSGLGTTCIRLSQLVADSISQLPNLKEKTFLLRNCDEIAKIKHEKKNMLRFAIACLLNSNEDIKIILKLKDVSESAKLIIDNYEDFSNTVKGIILEYS